MIKDKLKSNKFDDLLKNVLFITLVAAIFLFIATKFGGYISDYFTKSSCNAIDETYVEGSTPGSGVCVKTTGNIDIKK